MLYAAIREVVEPIRWKVSRIDTLRLLGGCYSPSSGATHPTMRHPCPGCRPSGEFPILSHSGSRWFSKQPGETNQRTVRSITQRDDARCA